MNLVDRTANFISQHDLLRARQRLVAAISGGPDSLALLIVLRQLGYRPLVAHLDHGLRPESEAEADFVQGLAERWRLPFRRARANPEEWTGSTEAAARAARYAFLFRVAKEDGLVTIATGHTMDDQVESILLHLLRGAGPAGLSGMRPDTDLARWTEMGEPPPEGGRLVRPLLCLGREETMALCRAEGLEPRSDPSNLDPSFLRNRLRHELVPELRQYNPAIKGALARTGEVMRAVSEWMDAELDERWPILVRAAGPRALALAWGSLVSLPLALRRHALQRAMAQLVSGDRQLEFSVIERALSYLAGGQGRATLVADLCLERAGAEAVLYSAGQQPSFPQVPQTTGTNDVDLDRELTLRDGWKLLLNRVELTEGERTALRQGQGPYAGRTLTAIHAAAVKGELRVRPPQPGDRIRPLGMAGRMKVSDFFVNEGVPRLQRAAWPLLVDNAGVVWVIGLRLDDRVKVRPDSQHILRAELHSEAEPVWP